jgi:hypothetical protein
MADPNTTQDRKQGAGAYDTSGTGDGEKMPSKVGVYERPANAGRSGGMNMMNLVIGLLLLLIVLFVVWQVIT